MPDRPVPGSPADWIRHARSDLEMARLAVPETILTEAQCFHAQQAAEKALKAVLLSRDIAVPHAHNIRHVLELLPTEMHVPQLVVQAAELSVHAVLTSYSSNVAEVTDEEHEEAVRVAEGVVTWAEHQLA